MQIGYLDPASGSIIASALVGGTAAMGVAVKSARKRIAGKFKRKPAADASGVEDASTTTPDAPDVAVDADA